MAKPAYINSLPNELISSIHEEAVLTYSYASPAPHLDSATLASISLVCRKWRQNSLGNGKLWAAALDIDRDTHTWVEEIVHRSKASPLVINSSKGYGYRRIGDFLQNFSSQTWQQVFKNASLWGTFSLKTALLNDKPNLDALVQGLKKPTPRLESFTLCNTCQPWPYDQDAEDEQFMLPDNLFGGHAPLLKAFDVDQVFLPVSFNFSLWKNLTSLKMSQDVVGTHYDVMKWTRQNWVDILRSLKLLEHLDLRDVFETADTGSGLSNVSDVHLSHLISLTLETTFQREAMFDVFSKIVVPSTCKIWVRTFYYGHQEYPPFAFQRLKRGLDRHVKAMLADNDDPSLLMELENSLEGADFSVAICLESDLVEDRPNGKPNFYFAQVSDAIDGTTLAPIPDHSFYQLLAALEDVPVHDLVIMGWPLIQAEDVEPLYRFFSRCQGMNTLEMEHTDLVILDILQKRQSLQGTILLPDLQSFVYDTRFDEDLLPRLEEFRSWRESVGKLPPLFEI
ncbi:hypothetical protein BDN70DRAFT_993662 [Pholiota conissans]|uniref:F-box domain-containing protein n=1 Tax=Pholiota conissans TaxID=109636 RepID=A0A9P5Z1I7_9AGAR|nr:hypothetical protein BDN70DRAFT_993662 [Pholiota conissans]